MNDSTARVVSSEDELLILVDAEDREIGSMSKAMCHDASGVLHRAFSIFLFDDEGRLLLQQRAQGKRLWPLYWSNTCCSHPRQGESIEVAAGRRLSDELHTSAELEFVYKFTYQANYEDRGAEHELCHVLLGRQQVEPRPNRTEIAAIRYLAPQQLGEEMARSPDGFTPWFRLEWERLSGDYAAALSRYTDL